MRNRESRRINMPVSVQQDVYIYYPGLIYPVSLVIKEPVLSPSHAALDFLASVQYLQRLCSAVETHGAVEEIRPVEALRSSLYHPRDGHRLASKCLGEQLNCPADVGLPVSEIGSDTKV